MDLLEVLRQTLATLRAHKMRSFLTMFGIVWGIASVILLVGPVSYTHLTLPTICSV